MTGINLDYLRVRTDQGTDGPSVESGYASMDLWHQRGTQRILNRPREYTMAVLSSVRWSHCLRHLSVVDS